MSSRQLYSTSSADTLLKRLVELSIIQEGPPTPCLKR
jgi:hypothetical protein